uniref:Uncharacterized protein n=1 Tax=Mesocestoides corti TaxID=53468 RepID=A0A5K3G0F2_MESCO
MRTPPPHPPTPTHSASQSDSIHCPPRGPLFLTHRLLTASRLCTDKTSGAASVAAVDAPPSPPTQPARPNAQPPFRSSTSSRSHLPRWSSMPPHSPVVAYSPALALALSRSDYPVTEVALGCAKSPSNNIHRNARLACCRSSTCCSRRFRHYPTTTTTYELQDQHHRLLMGVHTFSRVQCQSRKAPPPLALSSTCFYHRAGPAANKEDNFIYAVHLLVFAVAAIAVRVVKRGPCEAWCL